MKKCKHCNGPVYRMVDKSQPANVIRHVRNWGAENLEYSFICGSGKSKELDVCYYHYKKQLLKRK